MVFTFSLFFPELAWHSPVSRERLFCLLSFIVYLSDEINLCPPGLNFAVPPLSLMPWHLGGGSGCCWVCLCAQQAPGECESSEDDHATVAGGNREDWRLHG